MSNKAKIESLVENIALPIVEENNFDLVDVEYVKEANNWFLRLYIDKIGGITTDDCKIVSDRLSKELDKIDPIENSYYLEVSSPGLERALKKDKDFERYKGKEVEVKLFKAIDGIKLFNGNLIGLVNNKVTIKQGEKTLEFERKEVVSVKIVINFK